MKRRKKKPQSLEDRIAWGRLYMVLLHVIEGDKVKAKYAIQEKDRPQPHEDLDEPRKGLIRVSSSSYIIR